MADTISAIATPSGLGGISVIRVSGERAFEICDSIFKSKTKISESKSHTIHYGKIFDADELLDTVTMSVFRNPKSYTGEDVVEISCHGGIIVAKMILSLLERKGTRMAHAGEFTKRAFLNGKIDLSQAEAVADIIHSNSIKAAQVAARQLEGNFTHRLNDIINLLIETAGLLELELDFAEEDLEFVDKSAFIEKIKKAIHFCSDLMNSHSSAEVLRNGFRVGIVGFPNSGKSTLFNTLLSRHRAIVSHIPGTTRDYLEETIYINDIPIRLTDTAGIRNSEDVIEIEGVAMVDSIIKASDLIIVLNDKSKGTDNSNKLFEEIKSNYPKYDVVLVQNKIDLSEESIKDELEISAKENIGIDKLKFIIGEKALNSITMSQDILVNQRQAILLSKAIDSLLAAVESINKGYGNDVVAIDIRSAATSLGEISGRSWSEDVLNQVFGKFCIGK